MAKSSTSDQSTFALFASFAWPEELPTVFLPTPAARPRLTSLDTTAALVLARDRPPVDAFEYSS